VSDQSDKIRRGTRGAALTPEDIDALNECARRLAIPIEDFALALAIDDPRSEQPLASRSIRVFLDDVDRVVLAAEEISCDHSKAVAWLRQPLVAFDGQTPLFLTAHGRATDLLEYLNSIRSGFTG